MSKIYNRGSVFNPSAKAKDVLLKNGVSVEDAILLNNKNFQIPETIELIETSSVLETSMNYILKLENGNLMMSKDLGKTWTTKANTFGTIAHAHFFGDGTLMFCTWEKVYWTKDLVTISETLVLDENGNSWTCPSGQYHFFWQQKYSNVEVIDGVEIYYWGDYALNGNIKLWYTTDNGHTLKCAFNFGTSKIDNKIISCRHCHQFIYNKYDGYFYVTTGDHGTATDKYTSEIHLMRGKYSKDTDTWDWEMLGSGANYKFGQLLFDENFMYAITDYAGVDNTLPKGILKCPMDKLDAPSAYSNAWEDYETQINSGAGLVSLISDNFGAKLLTIDSFQPGYFFFAKNGFDFKRVYVGQNTQLGIRFTGPDYNGNYYATFKTFDMTQNACSISFYPTLNIKELMNTNGLSWEMGCM